jgi:hypothetical protein
MTMTIQQIEEQMAMLQSSLDKLKNPKLQVSRYFTGEYFSPYEGMHYRRMESDGIPLWECFLDLKKEWIQLDKGKNIKFEKIYQQDCVVGETIEEPTEEEIE